MPGERNVRVSLPGSSVIRPRSSSMRASCLAADIGESASPIRAVGPGGHQQGNMVGSHGIVDRKANGDAIEKGTYDPACFEVGANMKNQLVIALNQLRRRQQRPVTATVLIGRNGFERSC